MITILNNLSSTVFALLVFLFFAQFLVLTIIFTPATTASAATVTPATGTMQAQTQTPETITYVYDTNGQRIKVTAATEKNTTTTVYPTQYYNTDGTTVIKHMFANNIDVATINGTGSDAAVYYNHTDSLDSSGVITDHTGAISETMDYFPFGAIRLDNKASTFNEKRKYIGQEYDTDTGLNYLNARYYNSVIARFISEDLQFWGNQNLSDPQSLNSYSYAGNNPIRFADPNGDKKSDYTQAGFTPGSNGAFAAGAEMGTYKGVPLYAGEQWNNQLSYAQNYAISLTSPYDSQCTVGVSRIYKQAFGVDVPVVSPSNLIKNLPSNQFKSTTIGSFAPQENDIIVLGGGGHVGIVAEVDNGVVWTVEQNIGQKTNLVQRQLMTSTNNGVLTYSVTNQNGNNATSTWAHPLAQNLQVGSQVRSVRTIQTSIMSQIVGLVGRLVSLLNGKK